MTDTKWGKALTGPEMKALGLPDDTPVRHNKDVYLTRAFAFVDFCASYHLPKNHPAYTVHETNKRTGSRFVFHAGGDEPDDWDRGDVLVNDTHPRTIDGPAIDKYNWSYKYHRAKIIGYTRKGIVSETLVDDTQADTLTIKRMTEAERTRLYPHLDLNTLKDLRLIREETHEEHFTRETGHAVTDAVAAALNWGR